MRKKYLSLLGVAASVLAAGQASAGALGAPNEIFIGGATAVQRTFHLDIMLRFCEWDGNVNDADGVITPRVYTDSIKTLPGGGNPLASTPPLGVADQVVIHCTFDATLGGNLAGAEVAVHKYNGGSGTGVAPVADPATAPAADQEYLDPAGTCVLETNTDANDLWTSVDGSTRFQLFECSGDLKTQAPDGGISDVEPKVFVGELATGFGTSVPGITPDKPQNDFVDKGNLIVKPGAGIVFGVAATIQLRDELQADQFAAGQLDPACTSIALLAERDSIECMPSIPTAVVQGVYTGEIYSWDQRTIYGNTVDHGTVNQGKKVNFCRRTAGSGTNAQTAVHFLRTNCISDAPAMRTFANNVPAPAPAPNVYENSGSSDMDDCLDALGNGSGFDGDWDVPNFPVGPPTADGSGDSSIVAPGRTAFGIGYNSLERNVSLSRDYRFLAVDGAKPTLEEAYDGTWQDIYYLSYQNRVSAGTTPDPQLGGIRTVAADATELLVLEEFFGIWNSPTAAAVQAVNDGLIVDPDATTTNNPGDEWQGGFLVGDAAAPATFSAGPASGTDPRTPWSRETAGGTADSCQELSLKN